MIELQMNILSISKGLLFVTLLFIGCKKAEKRENHLQTISKEQNGTIVDTVVSEKIEVNQKITKDTSWSKKTNRVHSWDINQFIVECSQGYRNELIQDVQYIKSQWEHTKNPLVVSYQGSDIGDYLHIIFQDSKGNHYDFGSGNNNYSDVKLFKDTLDYIDNPTSINKRFKIYWDWKVSSFPCCSGAYEMVKAYQPSIIKIEPYMR